MRWAPLKLTSFKPLLVLLVVAGFSLGTILTHVDTTSALSGGEFQAGRIIDDALFFNQGDMSQQQIQDFLNAKVPTCDTNGTQMRGSVTRASYGTSQGYPPPYTCLKSYSQTTATRAPESGLCNGHTAGNKSSAQIIYEVSVSCGVSAKALIVLLQKEQSLITDDWPWSIQYRSATGYGCPDTAPCDAEYYGFFNQVYSAARQFKRYAKDAQLFNYRSNRNNTINYNPNAGCGSSSIFIQNPATAGLYNYTPYQPNQAALNNLYGTGDSCSAYGNRNFWRMFNDWFGTTLTGSYPSPLYRSESSGMIYAIVDAKKYYVPSYDVMIHYGFHRLPIANVSDSYLSTVADGTTLTNVGRKEYDPGGVIFLFDDGKEYAIRSPEQCTDWAIDCFNPSVAKVLPNNLFDRYLTWGGFLPDTATHHGFIYKLEGGKKRPLIGPYTVARFGGHGAAVRLKDANILQPLGAAYIDDRFTIKFGSNPTLYFHDRGNLYPILDMRDFDAWGLYTLGGAHVPGSFDSEPLPRVSPLYGLVRTLDGKTYVISNGRRHSTAGRDADFNDLPKTTFNFPGSQADRLPDAPLPDVLRASGSGEIFTMSNEKKRVFASMEDITGLGFNPQSMMNISQSLANSLGYDGLNLAPGKMYKVNGTSEIRLRHHDGYLYVRRLDYPELNYSRTLNVDTATGALYRNLGNY